MFEHRITSKWSSDGRVVDASVTASADGEDNRTVDVASDADKALVAFVADVEQIKSIFIIASQDMTIDTNSDIEAVDSIDLKADVPLIWQSDNAYFDCPFTQDITKLYVTNTSNPATAATLEIRMLIDSTE